MVQKIINNKTYEFATNLRVAFAMKDIVGAKNLSEAVKSMTQLDTDKQISLIYAAYKAAQPKGSNILGFDDFLDEVVAELGIFAINDLVENIIDGITYSGLSKEEVEVKKKMVEEQMSQAGEISSAKDSK